MKTPTRMYFAPVPSRLIVIEYGEGIGDSYFTAPGVLSDQEIVEICRRWNAFPALLAAADVLLQFDFIEAHFPEWAAFKEAVAAAAEGAAPAPAPQVPRDDMTAALIALRQFVMEKRLEVPKEVWQPGTDALDAARG